MRSSGFDPVAIDIFNSRLKKVTLLILAAFAALVFRLWFLQIISGPSYRSKSEKNRIHLQDIPPFRGMIFDRNGELLVDNRPSYHLYIIPEEIQDRKSLLKSLERLIGLKPSTVRSILKSNASKSPFKPIAIKKNISRIELAVLETNLFNLAGVMIQVQPQRHYIYNQFASHLIGYLGEISERQLDSGKYVNNKAGDLIGKYGVEGKWQQALNGFRGGAQVEVDAAGRKLRIISQKPPISGANIYLTIEKDVQAVAEDELKGKKGALVAINPNNGEILALASSPAFDPNVFIGGIDIKTWKELASSKDYPLQNRSISGQYPPGSTFKIAVALAGLEEGIIDPKEEIFCNGSYSVGNHLYRCWRKVGHGRVSFHKALVESCDVYFYNIGRRLGIDKIAQYAKQLGLGIKTDFDLGYERSGLIPNSQWKLKRWGVPWQAGETVSASIGQSFVLVTPLQMARFISAVFNGGHLYQPKVIKGVVKGDQKIDEFTPRLIGKVKHKVEHMALIKEALIGVVNERRGTGSKARVQGITVAGKTGTAQVIRLAMEKSYDRQGGIPDEFKDHAWFVAIAPADKPRLALAVLVENGGHGGSAAAPIAKKVLEAYFNRG